MAAQLPDWLQVVQASETLSCSLFELTPAPVEDWERREWVAIARIWGQFKVWRDKRAQRENS